MPPRYVDLPAAAILSRVTDPHHPGTPSPAPAGGRPGESGAAARAALPAPPAARPYGRRGGPLHTTPDTGSISLEAAPSDARREAVPPGRRARGAPPAGHGHEAGRPSDLAGGRREGSRDG